MHRNLKQILNDVDDNKFVQRLDENALICTFNLQGDFTYISEAFCSLLGYSNSQLLSSNIDLLYPRTSQKKEIFNWREILAQNRNWSGKINFLTKNGKLIELEGHVSPLSMANGEKVNFYGAFKLNSEHVDFDDHIKNDSSYKWFFEKSPIPKSLICLNSLQYIDVNKSWETYTGFNKEDVVNRAQNELEFHDCINLEFLETFKANNEASFQIDKAKLSIKSKEKRYAILTFEKIYINGDAYLLEIINDTTERLRYQKELKDTSKSSILKKDTILKLAGLDGEDLDYVFQEITALSSKTLQVERVSIWSFNKLKTELRCEKSYGFNAKGNLNKIKFKIESFSNYFKALFKNFTILADDALNDKRTKDFSKNYLEPLGITSILDVLIQGPDGYFGVLSFEQVGVVKEWTTEDEEFATSISNIISLAIERNERHEAEIQLLKSNEKLVTLNAELNKLKRELEQENIYLREEIDLVFNYEEMVYGSAVFSQVLTEVEQVANTDATVLLLGESGTGKELIARAIHNISNRKSKPLIKVNCAAIPKELLESELFGHKQRSFTGAIKDKLGKFQLADGGTLFLDEIGELPLDMQPKLLRAIQESEIEQIGGTETIKVDIRIIAATNRNLEKAIKENTFREDLYFRINVFPITIPPLRERVEDIPILIEHFANKFSKLYKKNIKYISEATKSDLQSYPWPGNIRELENLIERAVILSNNDTLNIPNFKSSEKESLISSTVLSLDDVLRIHIKRVLNECDWKIEGQDGAAELLGLKPSTLRDRINKLGIQKS